MHASHKGRHMKYFTHVELISVYGMCTCSNNSFNKSINYCAIAFVNYKTVTIQNMVSFTSICVPYVFSVCLHTLYPPSTYLARGRKKTATEWQQTDRRQEILISFSESGITLIAHIIGWITKWTIFSIFSATSKLNITVIMIHKRNAIIWFA